MQKMRYSHEDEQLLMSQLWSPTVKDDPEAFVLFAFPWGRRTLPLSTSRPLVPGSAGRFDVLHRSSGTTGEEV